MIPPAAEPIDSGGPAPSMRPSAVKAAWANRDGGTRYEAGTTLAQRLWSCRALAVAERQRDEAGRAVDLHAHQNAMLALRLGVLQRLDDVARVADRLAADVEDDGADLEAGIGG